MNEPQVSLELHVGIRWWVMPYLWILKQFCIFYGDIPDPVKLEALMRRGIKLRVIKRCAATGKTINAQ